MKLDIAQRRSNNIFCSSSLEEYISKELVSLWFESVSRRKKINMIP